MPQRAFDAASTAHWTAQVFQAYQGDWGEFDRGALSPTEVVQRIAQRTGLRPDEVQSVVDAGAPSLQPIPAALDLMAQLRRPGQPMFFLSNMPAPYAEHLEREHACVRDFEDGVFSSRVKLIKPDPAIFALAAKRFDLPPAELVFVDDVPVNPPPGPRRRWPARRRRTPAQPAASQSALRPAQKSPGRA